MKPVHNKQALKTMIEFAYYKHQFDKKKMDQH